MKNSGDIAVSYANNTIFKGKINNTPAEYLENIVSNVQTQIDEIGSSGGGMFQIYGESKNINSTFNNGHCFSFGSSVTSIHDLKINGDCILNKVYIYVKPTVTNSRAGRVVIEVWYRPSDTTLLLYPDLMNESIAAIKISTSQTTNSWYDITGKSFYAGDILQIINVLWW